MSTRPRVLVLTHQDSNGHHGLAADLRAIQALGAEALPVVTGVTSGPAEAPEWLWPMPGRVLAPALDRALDAEPVAVYVGLVGRRRTVRRIAEMLHDRGPSALVVAPLSLAFDARPLLGRNVPAAVLKWLLPEAQVAVVPADQVGGLLPLTAEGLSGMRAAGAALRDRGARTVWLRAGSHEGRSIDVVLDHNGSGLLDYPPPGPGAEPHVAPAALAALLAIGVPVREAIDRAHRHAHQLDRTLHRVVG